jgi:hypothetical protein
MAVVPNVPNPPTWVQYAWGFMSGGVSAMAVKGNTLYIAGDFQGFYDGSGNLVNAKNVASLDTSTGIWTPIGTGTPGGSPPPSVTSIAVDSTGRVYIGMDAHAPVVSGNLKGMVATLDVLSQQWLPVGGGVVVDEGYNGQCYPVPQICPLPRIDAMCSSGTNIYISGCFSNVGGATAAYRVAKWNSQAWTSLAPSPDWCYRQASCSPSFNAIVASGNAVYLTGEIRPPCASTYPQGLAEFSPTGAGLISNDSDNLWAPPGAGEAIGWGLCFKGCYVYVTGNFNKIGSSDGSGGVSASGIAKKSGLWLPLSTGLKLGSDPGTATSLAAGTYEIYVLSAVANGEVTFDSAGGVSTDNIAVWTSPY